MYSLIRTVLLVLFVLALPLAAEDRVREKDSNPLADWKIDKTTWQGEMGARKVLEVRNVHGDIRTRIADGGEVMVSAVVQHHVDDPLEVEIAVEPQDGRLLVEVRYRPRAGAFSAVSPPLGSPQEDTPATLPEHEKRRADLTVLVPAGVRLEAQTEDGLIEAKGLESDVAAHSESGNITLAVTGHVEARSDHGEIVATFKSTGHEPSSLETVTGDITAWLGPETAARLGAETYGVISTDYSIEIERRDPYEKKYAAATIGKGGPRLTVKSDRGALSFFRLRY